MNPLFYLRSVQNTFSFTIRSRLNWSREISATDAVLRGHQGLQDELREFLDLFDWSALDSRKISKQRISVADVGTRDFSFAPVFREFFSEKGLEAEIHGIEIDAFRRYANLRSRADYGRYYARTVPLAHYHPCDFLKWRKPLDFCFMLHPFVTPEPPLRWGLPLSKFRPRRLFEHAWNCLNPAGLLLLSCPSEKEFGIAADLALSCGFIESETRTWKPRLETFHQKPRIGRVYCKRN